MMKFKINDKVTISKEAQEQYSKPFAGQVLTILDTMELMGYTIYKCSIPKWIANETWIKENYLVSYVNDMMI